ncbi:hypothetical protein CFSAN002367_24716 [Clostridium botulinum CFSAN002367]|nr:hypothetical protein CFSAN002369_28311 [Clostridium botulinum CFSAN002369]EPS47195.1 hypothetical protein CFSAN002367_24716 [Clostridium botulinum CFSAN002367]EPS52465.1 hypothetical protein CFSAN002368_07970 [Clostridium botulinum A1 str. CFSAN002368]
MDILSSDEDSIIEIVSTKIEVKNYMEK